MSEQATGQLNFQGRVVTGVNINFPGKTLKQELTIEEEQFPDYGDVYSVTTFYVVNDPHFPMKFNSEGIGIGALKSEVETFPLAQQEVKLIKRKRDADEEWEKKQGRPE